jgi:hypothetical protein
LGCWHLVLLLEAIGRLKESWLLLELWLEWLGFQFQCVLVRGTIIIILLHAGKLGCLGWELVALLILNALVREVLLERLARTTEFCLSLRLVGWLEGLATC